LKPAKQLGLATVRINRKSICRDIGIALPATSSLDIEVPDLNSLVGLMGL